MGLGVGEGFGGGSFLTFVFVVCSCCFFSEVLFVVVLRVLKFWVSTWILRG